jgi:hypothetical protein
MGSIASPSTSQSTNAATNQQVGVGGGTGNITLGAITTRGGNITSTKTVAAASRPVSGKGITRNTGSSGGSGSATHEVGGTPAAAPANTVGGGAGGSGNVSLNITTADTAAVAANADVAKYAIGANASLVYQVIAGSTGISEMALQLVADSSNRDAQLTNNALSALAQNSSDVTQAGQNLAALGIGGQVAQDLISPTGGTQTNPATNTDTMKMLTYISIAIGVALLLRKT